MTKKRAKLVVEILLVAGLYIVAALPAQYFVIHPGNLSPVWLPSGLMLAVALLRGPHIWPGIFLGALIASGWTYLDTATLSSAAGTLFAVSSQALGEVICTLVAVSALGRGGSSTKLFQKLSVFRLFLVYGVMAGPLISALFGVASLWLVGLIQSAQLLPVLVNWWVGDAVGVLLLTPVILSLHSDEPWIPAGRSYAELATFLAVAIVLPTVDSMAIEMVGYPIHGIYLSVPLLLWSVIRLGVRPTLLVSLYIVVVELLLSRMGQTSFNFPSPQLAVLSFQTFVIMTVAPILVVAALLKEKTELMAALQDRVIHDALTQAFNRQYLSHQVEGEIARQFRYKSPFSLLMLDIDFFKSVNDRFGHQVGDQVLVALVRLVQDEIRENDVLARWGGEEFVILMPETTAQGAALFAERIRVRVAETNLLPSGQLTVSLGVIQYRPGAPLDDILDQLDAALYQAKRDGRNLVRIAAADGKSFIGADELIPS